MPERLSRERLALYLRLIKGAADPNARATASFIEGHIAALEAENERLRVAARDVLDMLPYHGLLDLPGLRAALEVGE